MNSTQEAHKALMEAQLREWSAKLDVLKAKADQTGAEARLEVLAQIDKLKELRSTAEEHLAKAQTTATDAWESVRNQVTERWNQVSGAVEALLEKKA